MPISPKSNVPEPDYVQLLGRDDKVIELKRYLSGRFFIIAVEGLGGIGKSALTTEVCRYYIQHYENLPDEEKFEYIVWVSAKLSDMTPEGSVLRSAVQATLDAIYKKIAEVLEIPSRLSLEEDKLVDAIYTSLSANRVLIVIDSFEQIERPDAVIDFIENVPPPSKVIVTTRPQQTVSTAKAIKLEGLNTDQAIQLVDQFQIKELSKEQKAEICQYSSGIPLVIKWALGRMKMGEPYSGVVSKLKKGDLNLSQFCVSDSIEFVSGRKAEEILYSLLPIVTPITRQSLGEIVDLGKEIRTRDDEISLLMGLQLIVRTKGDKFILAPISKAALAQNYTKDKQIKVIGSWARYYKEFVASILDIHGRVDGYSDNLQKLFSEAENVIEILSALDQIDPILFCELLEMFRYILYMRGDWIERDTLLTKGKNISEKLGDWCRELLFSSDLAWVSTYRQQSDRSLFYFKSVEEALQKCNTSYYKAKYYMDFGRYRQMLAFEDSDFEEVEKLYMQAVEEAKQATPQTIQSTCLYYLGLLYYHEIKNMSQAKRCFEDGIKIANKFGATREANRHTSMLAVILAENGKYADARDMFDKIIIEAENNNDKVRHADYKLALGKIEYLVGHREDAFILLNQAIKIYDELGRVIEVEEIKRFCRDNGLGQL